MENRKHTKKIPVKVFSLLIAAVMFAAVFAGCSGSGDGGKKTEDGKMQILTDIDAKTYYQNGTTANFVVGLDQLDRTVSAVSGEKDGHNRDVGIFYFLTLGQHGAQKIYNVEEILKMENGLDLLFHSDNEVVPDGATCFWSEPLYGYYNSSDPWVIRRHLALLTLAGVDFLVFDTTNAVTYDTVVAKIISEAKKMIDEGWDVPRLVFYTNAYSHVVIESLYNNYYKRGKNDAVWYYVDGKPLIIGNISVQDDKNALGNPDYNPKELSQEILDYFTIRESQWPSLPYRENGFPWIEWEYPAPVHNDVINVCVASHPQLPMSYSLTRGAKNWGRGWNVETKENDPDKILEGALFQSTWDVAIEKDPGIVFVTGWNEWCAGKFLYGDEYVLVDQCNLEFSRDAEMMKGGLNDAFYIQLAKNIRAYKNVEIPANACLESVPVTVPMTDDLSVWDNVDAVFRDAIVVNKARNCNGATPSLHYEQAAARNHVTEVRIAQDAENIYYLIRTEEDITAREDGDSGWMNIFIGTGPVARKGWEGYEFVVGRSDVGDGKLSVEKLSADFTGEAAGEAAFTLSGNVMQVAIPRSVLGIDAENNNLYFKIADAVDNPSDIMDYYISGESFPLGRLSYRYIG